MLFARGLISPQLIILISLYILVLAGNNSLRVLKDIDFEAFTTINSAMSTCIGQCLGLKGQSEKCNFDRATGQAVGGACAPDFVRPSGSDRRVICVFEKTDIERGLTLDMLIASKLCTTILVLVTIRFDSKVPTNIEMVIVDEDLHKDAAMMSEKSGVKLHYKLGTGMNMTDSMNPTDFSKVFDMTSRRGKWADSIVALCAKPEGAYYSGLYIRWLYPGCPNDDCKIGPARDEHNFIKALDELQLSWKKKFPNKYWEIAMETSAKADNIYMGLGVEKLGKILSYFLILTYEWAEPRPTTTPPKTLFQTPFAKNSFAIDGYLAKHRTPNKKFFYGITSTLVRYAISDSANAFKFGRAKLSEDEFYINSSASNWIHFSEACALVANKSNNFTIIVPNSDNKTTYAKNEHTFIAYDETHDIMAKVGRIFDRFNNKIGGIWMKNISSDDFTGKICGCGAYPSLRSASEGLYAGSCKMKSCFLGKA